MYFLLSIYLLELDPSRGEFQNSEYFIKDHYDSVLDSLTLFSKDDLLHAPGSVGILTTLSVFSIIECRDVLSQVHSFTTQLMAGLF